MTKRKQKTVTEKAQATKDPHPLHITELRTPQDAFQCVAQIVLERLEVEELGRGRGLPADKNVNVTQESIEVEQAEDEAWDEICEEHAKLIPEAPDDRKAWLRDILLRLSSALMSEVIRQRENEA